MNQQETNLSEQQVTPRKRRVLPPQRVWPLLFTLGNLVSGFAAIHYSYKGASWHGPWGWSGLTMAGSLIFLGMLLDSIDGSVARLTRSVTELGAALDSLSDLVTCGVAPAVMVLSLVASYLGTDGQITLLGPDADLPWGKVVWGIAAVYVCCAALRLARFTVETEPAKGPNDHIAFHGMPSPGAAGLIASLILLHQHVLAGGGDSLWIGRAYAFGVPIVMLMSAVAMVSNIPYDHFVNRYLGRPQSFRFIAFLVIIIFTCAWWFQETVAIVFVAYSLSGPVHLIRNKNNILSEDL
ncbi:MAG: CDP-alcohol phosphatidyltransferase family protein [Phycisphaerales bacterium]|jgi:CDP-diacylglycerol--serine O-phosphatidyltransferase|nr:CDP-alcohol phosphatidyltransferase family protein [Phycisphaerales bacterium]